MYLPPNEANNLRTVLNLIKILKHFVSKREVYVLGDFNFSSYKGDNNTSTCTRPLKEFIIFLEEQSLYQLVRSPTHIHGNTLDLVITSTPQNVTSLEIINPLTASCDHNMIELKIHCNFKNKTNRTRKRNFYKANYTKINAELSLINWQTTLLPYTNIDAMYSKFLEIINEVIQRHVPLSKVRKKSKLPKEIRTILKQKRFLFSKSKSDKSFKNAYKEQEKLYKKAMIKYRYSQEAKVLKSNSKKALYSYVNNKLNTRHHIPPLKRPDGKICLESKEKADLLNHTFSQIFLKDTTSLRNPNLSHSNHNIIPTDYTTIQYSDILTAINQLKNSVSQSPDSIPSLFIKKTSKQISKTPTYYI